MQIGSEASAGPAASDGRVREPTAGAAFGLALEIDSEIEIPGIAVLLSSSSGSSLAAASANRRGVTPPTIPPSSSLSQPPTRVKLDPRELDRRWAPIAHTSKRVRELRDGGTMLLAVELALPAGYLLHAPGLARILIAADGCELLCDPQPGGAEWTTLLPAQALPLAATLRGLEVLHASGVVLGKRAALFAGAPGTGKSSLAAALLHRGAALLSDDVVALDQRGEALIAHPGAALLHLQDREHERLSAHERAVLGAPAAFPGKRRYHPSTALSPAQFGGLFLLEHAAHGPPVERIEAVNPFALLASTFNLSVRTPERLIRHLDLTAALVATERIYRVRIQPGMDATRLADTLHDRLLEL